MKKVKYKLVSGLLATSIASGIVLRGLFPPSIARAAETTDYNSKEFAEELINIEEATEITFTNKGLYDIVASRVRGELTTENIKTITTLEIDRRLTNEDISDLKYLTNLKFLIIKNNDVDCSDLSYNQQLIGLKIEGGTLSNTTGLPNSITNLRLKNTRVLDYALVLPYFLEELNIQKSPINSINAKNNDSIKRIKINGETYLSAKDLTYLTSLKFLSITDCSSLKDSEYLNRIPSLKYLHLNEYATIWLDKDTLDKLPMFPLTKILYQDKIEELDQIAREIRDDSLSDIEQITKIIEYLMNRYKYDEIVNNSSLKSKITSSIDNALPITVSLKDEKIICINYAAMFQSLANRTDIESILLVNDNHAWNAYNIEGEYRTIDPTSIDSFFTANSRQQFNQEWIVDNSYNTDETELKSTIYEGVVYPISDDGISTEIGYIKTDDKPDGLIGNIKDSFAKLFYNNLTFDLYSEPSEFIVPTLLILEAIYIYKFILSNKKEKKENVESKKTLKKNKKIRNTSM